MRNCVSEAELLKGIGRMAQGKEFDRLHPHFDRCTRGLGGFSSDCDVDRLILCRS